GAWGYLGVLAGSWAVGALPVGLSSVARAVRGRRWRARVRAELRTRGVPIAFVLLPCIAIIVITLSNENARAQEQAFYRQMQNPLSSVVSKGSLVSEWTAINVASDWQSLAGVVTV